MPGRLPIRRIGGKVRGDCLLPLVAIGEQFGLVVEQFLTRFGREFEVWPFDDRVHRARLLAQPAIDALDHVNVVARGSAATVLARLGFDGDRERRADRLAQFAGDAALLAVRVAAKRMLAAEARRGREFLVRIIDGRLGLEEVLQRQPVGLDEVPEEEGRNRADHTAALGVQRPDMNAWNGLLHSPSEPIAEGWIRICALESFWRLSVYMNMHEVCVKRHGPG